MPMALYKHVANKDELLDGMIDVVVGEIDPPRPEPMEDRGARADPVGPSRAAPPPLGVAGAWSRGPTPTPAVLGLHGLDDRRCSAPAGSRWT